MKTAATLALGVFLFTLESEELMLESREARLAAIVRVPDGHQSPHPGVVLVHGSGRLTARDMLANSADRLVQMGFVVLAYDKRGVGGSTGEYTSIGSANSVRMFDLLATDALAGVAALKARKDVDPKRIGLLGFSQGGWIAPLAASRTSDVAFVVTVSGPAVSVGEEIAYSRLAGEDPGSEQGLSDDEIDRRMRDFRGPHGYDPSLVLSALGAPSFWILGEKDHSIPLRRTVENLSRLQAQRKPVTTHVIPGVNHGLRDPVTGTRPDVWRPIAEWLAGIGVIAPPSKKPL